MLKLLYLVHFAANCKDCFVTQPMLCSNPIPASFGFYFHFKADNQSANQQGDCSVKLLNSASTFMKESLECSD